MGMYGGSSTTADANIGLSQQKLADLAEDNQEYYQANFAPVILDQMQQQIDISGRQADQQEALQDFQLSQARQYNDRYWNTQVSLEDEMISKARQYGETGQQEYWAGQAAGDVSQSFGQARQGLQQTMARRGVGLGSGAGLSALSRMGTEEALARAGAMNQTREAARQLGWTRLGEAAALGRGLPSFGATSSQLASGAGMNAVSAGGAGMSAATGAAASYGNNVGMSGNLWNSVGNLGVNKYRADIAAEQAGSSGWGAMMGGIGGLAEGVGTLFGGRKDPATISTKTAKSGGAPVSGEQALKGLRVRARPALGELGASNAAQIVVLADRVERLGRVLDRIEGVR